MQRWKKLLILLLALGMPFSACNNPDEEEQPTTEETLQSLMPHTQYLVAYRQGLDMARFQLQWTQQLSGIRGTFIQVDRYGMEPAHTNDIWYFYYDEIHFRLQELIELASETDALAYRGMANILQAYSLGFMTDTWGDLPYSAADKYFEETGYPAYDSQEILYVEIMDLISKGISDIREAALTDHMRPGRDADPLYGGDLDKWEKAANVIKLRYLLRLANYDGDYAEALDHINNSELFANRGDDMIYEFNQDPGQVNPHYFFDNERGHTRVGKFFTDLLKENNDPRLQYYVNMDANGEYEGTPPGEGRYNASLPSSEVASQDSPISLISYTEQQFIQAEVFLKTGNRHLADQAFGEAVISSLRACGIEDATWEDKNAYIENVSLEQIINAKYVALFLNPEVWTDYRRTGYPELPPYEDAPEEEIPRRFVYPLNEYEKNADNIPDDAGLFNRLWWDVE